jgi:hypothetical protein
MRRFCLSINLFLKLMDKTSVCIRIYNYVGVEPALALLHQLF